MDLRAPTRSVQDQLTAAAAIGDEATRSAAQMLSVALEPALRLALQDVVGQLAAEVSAELAPGRVEVALTGGGVDVRVVPAPTEAAQPSPAPAPAPAGSEEPEAEAATARITFRPPSALKTRLERAAAQESLSLNTYLVRALTAHLDQPAPAAPAPSRSGRINGWFL